MDRARHGKIGYSVVRFLKKDAAKGAATTKINTDQIKAASTGCCIGHTWMVADGFGLPHRLRTPAVTALTGFQSATAWSQPGMCWVGTIALETKAKGNRTRAASSGWAPGPGAGESRPSSPCAPGRRRR